MWYHNQSRVSSLQVSSGCVRLLGLIPLFMSVVAVAVASVAPPGHDNVPSVLFPRIQSGCQ